jgi:hypothetical protein
MAETTLLDVVTALNKVPQKVVDTGCELIKDLLGYPFKAAGGLIGDTIYQYQCLRRVEIADRAKTILDEKKIAPRVMAPGFLLTYFEAAGYVDDDEDLKQMWARLLASAVENEEAAKRVFVNVLKQLGPAEVKLLQSLWNQPTAHLGSGHNAFYNVRQNDGASVERATLLMVGLLERVIREPQYQLNQINGQAFIAPQSSFDDNGLRFTPLARIFLKAVSRSADPPS